MITQQQRDLMELAPEIHQTNVEKGFWPENRNKGEQVMLIISELGECLEGHRENKRINPEYIDFDSWADARPGIHIDGHQEPLTREQLWEYWFHSHVKGTIEEEIADVIIRLIDYIYGWNVPYIPREFTFESKGNFGEDLLGVTRRILNMHATEHSPEYGGAAGFAMANILRFCEWYGIDIMPVVQWKMRYNKTRPPKHGKAY